MNDDREGAGHFFSISGQIPSPPSPHEDPRPEIELLDDLGYQARFTSVLHLVSGPLSPSGWSCFLSATCDHGV